MPLILLLVNTEITYVNWQKGHFDIYFWNIKFRKVCFHFNSSLGRLTLAGGVIELKLKQTNHKKNMLYNYKTRKTLEM